MPRTTLNPHDIVQAAWKQIQAAFEKSPLGKLDKALRTKMYEIIDWYDNLSATERKRYTIIKLEKLLEKELVSLVPNLDPEIPPKAFKRAIVSCEIKKSGSKNLSVSEFNKVVSEYKMHLFESKNNPTYTGYEP